MRNPSFEDTLGCPTTPNQLYKCQYWINPTQGSPDYFNSCDPTIYGMNVPYTGGGYQNARSGNAFAGFYLFQKGIPNYREYIQTKLSDTLQLNHKYLVSFYLNLSNVSQYSISNAGAFFSSLPISSTNSLVLNYTPQIKNNPVIQLSDSVNWMLVEDTLISDGTELYMTIGNFDDNSQTDTSYIGWFSSNNIAYYYIDDVSVIDIGGVGIDAQSSYPLHIYPNPVMEFLIVDSKNIRGKLSVVDLLGNALLRKAFDATEKIDVRALPVGIYFLKFENDKGVFCQKFLKD